VAAATAASVAKVQNQCGMRTDEAEFVSEALCPTIMEVVFEWARQVPFTEICKMTNVQEGSIVRYIVRLEECAKEIRSAARVIGNPSLFKIAEEASTLIKRDVVFAASLYVQ
jgi:antiviral helicase SKI2